jgi:hypothetical protein
VKYLLPLALLAMSLTGCSQRMADLTLISPHNVNLNGVNLDKLPGTKDVVGRSETYLILGLIPLGLPSLEDAVDDALRRGNGDLMTDVTVSRTAWYALAVSNVGIEVRGNVVRTRGGNQ